MERGSEDRRITALKAGRWSPLSHFLSAFT